MSYATMPTFEGNRLGVRRLSTLSGLYGFRGLGDAAQDALVQQLTSAGYDPGDIQTLIVMGATDNDLANLLNGGTTVGGLMNQLANPNQQLPQPQPVSLVTGPAQPPLPTPSPTGTPNYQIPAQTAGAVPAGSTLTFTAAWSLALLHPLTSADTVIASMTTGLAPYGISVLSSSPTSNGPINYGIQLVCKNNVAFGQWSDVQSIFNSLIQSIVGNNLTATPQLVLTSVGGQLPATAAPGAPQTITTWFESNWGYLVAALAAIVILPPVIKKL